MSKYLILAVFLFSIVSNAEANLNNIELLGRTQLLMINGSNDIHVVDNYAYVCVLNSLIIVDISDPKNPTVLSRLGTPDSIMGIYVAGNYAYIANNESGVRVIDISDPKNPVEVDVFNTSGKVLDIHVLGNYAYVADGKGGLLVFDVSNLKRIKESGRLPMFAISLYVANNYAYVLGTREAANSLYVIDISNPDKMKNISNEKFGILNEEIYVDNQYAYIISFEGLYIADISDPMNIRRVSHYKRLGLIDAKFSGNYAYIVTVDVIDGNMVTRVNVIDISDLSGMREIAFCEIPKSAYTCIDAVDEYIYVIDGEGYLCIFKFNPPKISVELKHKLTTKWGYLRNIPTHE